MNCEKGRLLKSGVILFGSIVFALLASLLLHEAGHAIAMWMTGTAVKKIVIRLFVFSYCVPASPMSHPKIVLWAGSVLGSMMGLVLAALGWRRREPVAVLAIMTGVVSCAHNGVSLIYDAATLAGGDATWLVLYGTPRAVIFAAGSVMLGAGIVLGCISVPLIGIRPEDGVKARATVFAAGILPWAGIPAVAWALGGGVPFRHWAVSAVVAVAIVLCASAGTKLLQSRWPGKVDGAKGIKWTEAGLVNAAGFGLLALLVVLGGRNSFVVEKINPTVDYVAQLNELAKGGRPEHLNGAAYYDRAVELWTEPPDNVRFDVIEQWPPTLNVSQRGLWEKWVHSNAAALSQFELGTRCPYYWRERDGRSVWEMELPPVRALRDLALTILLRARLSAASGRMQDVVDDVMVCYRYASHTVGSLHPLEQLSGVIVCSGATRVALRMLETVALDEAFLKEFQDRMEQYADELPGQFDVRFRKLKVLDLIQRVFTDDGRGDGRICVAAVRAVSSELMDDPLSNDEIVQCAKRRRRETTEAVNRAFDYIGSILEKSPRQLECDTKLAEDMMELTGDNLLVCMFLPNIPLLVEFQARYRTETGALITVLALLRYKAVEGPFPSHLQALVQAGYIKELPIDPFSGRVLAYKRTEDNFVLYSFGADFDDDGGAPSYWGKGEKGGDQVFWPLRQAGAESRIDAEQ